MNSSIQAGGWPGDFEMRYRQAPDPWGFATSEYERDRYQTTIASLTRRSYRRVFEPGCSVGELTARLAQFCEQVVATDLAPSAVARARQRCRAFRHVQVYQSDLASGPPYGPFDLIVFSEIGYYFERRRLIDIALDLASELDDGGEFVAVHWLGNSRDHVLHGDAVHSLLTTYLPLEWIKGERHEGFRIDSWKRA